MNYFIKCMSILAVFLSYSSSYSVNIILKNLSNSTLKLTLTRIVDEVKAKEPIAAQPLVPKILGRNDSFGPIEVHKPLQSRDARLLLASQTDIIKITAEKTDQKARGLFEDRTWDLNINEMIRKGKECPNETLVVMILDTKKEKIECKSKFEREVKKEVEEFRIIE
jgi:hypothetical protein